jgi:hypothetical protein
VVLRRFRCTFTSRRDGLIRTDTTWKTLGRANVLHGSGYTRLVFLTTNLPRPGSVGDRALRAASSSFFDAIEMMTPAGKERLRRYADGGPNVIAFPGYRTAAELYENVALPPSYGASLAVPVNVLGPLPKAFKKAIAMPHHLSVLVPSVTQDDQPIPAESRQDASRRIKEILGNLAGGCTAQEGTGSWVHPLAGGMDEHVTVVEAYSSRPFTDDDVGKIVSVILTDLDQHTAALVIDRAMYHFS